MIIELFCLQARLKEIDRWFYREARNYQSATWERNSGTTCFFFLN